MPSGRKAKKTKPAVNRKRKAEKRRISRQYARKAAGKKPLVEPLKIASKAERERALREGKMVFYDGSQRIELPLFLGPFKLRLSGIYRVGKAIITLRLTSGVGTSINVFELKKGPKGFVEGNIYSIFSRTPSLGHMILDESLRGRGLGLKAVSKAERHVRATQQGSHKFKVPPKFKRLFEKLGYEETGRLVDRNIEIRKKGKFQPLDDLDKFHRIEAIDPKTGKARIFTFPIKRPPDAFSILAP